MLNIFLGGWIAFASSTPLSEGIAQPSSGGMPPLLSPVCMYAEWFYWTFAQLSNVRKYRKKLAHIWLDPVQGWELRDWDAKIKSRHCGSVYFFKYVQKIQKWWHSLENIFRGLSTFVSIKMLVSEEKNFCLE